MHPGLIRIVAAVAIVAACSSPESLGDGRDDPFLVGGKADGYEWADGSPVAYAVLSIVNTYSQAALIEDVHLASNAAAEILRWRDGGQAINTLWELDNVPFIGRNTIKALVRHVEERELVVHPTNQAQRRLRHAGLAIAEYAAYPANDDTGEYIEIYNAGPIAIDLVGLQVSDGDAEDSIEAVDGGSTVLAPGATAIVLDRDYADDYALPADALAVTVGTKNLGNGITGVDPMFLYRADQWTLVDGAGTSGVSGAGMVRRPLVGPGTANSWHSTDCAGSPFGFTPGAIDCVLAGAAPRGSVGIGGACPLGAMQCDSGICLVDSIVGGATCAADCSVTGCAGGSTCITLDDDSGTGIDRVCVPDQTLECAFSQERSESFGVETEGRANRFSGSCGGETAADDAVRWTAPESGSYQFRLYTQTPSWEPACGIIYAVSDDCDRELACARPDRVLGGPTEIEVDLEAGESIRIVADSMCEGSHISGFVDVERISSAICPQIDAGSAVGGAVAAGETEGLSAMAGSCGGGQSAETTVAWTAPASGLYRFDTAGSSFDTVIYALGGGCGGTELACGTSELSLYVEAGQQIVLVIDGAFGDDGAFSLAIREEEPGQCPDDDIDSEVGTGAATGSTAAGTNRLAGSCGGALGPERVFRWRAPDAGQYTFDTFGSPLGTVLYALDGGCDGAELACNDDASGGHQSRITLDLAAGQVIALVVDSWSSFGGEFVLNVRAPDDTGEPGDDPYDDLSEAALRSALHGDVVGHTVLNYNFARTVMFSTLHNEDGVVRCVYTNVPVQTTGIPDPAIMNTEHTWAKSWGPDTFETRSDLHHLYPTLTSANSARAAYRFGEVVTPQWQSGGSQLGNSTTGEVVFEPRDQQKGNVARSLFYFSVRYDASIDGDQEQVLKQWNHNDPPDAAERARNAQVQQIQGKRNPFIDFPDYPDRISDF